MNNGYRVEIGKTALDCNVYDPDGKNITKYVRSISIEVAHGELTRLTLDLIPKQIEARVYESMTEMKRAEILEEETMTLRDRYKKWRKRIKWSRLPWYKMINWKNLGFYIGRFIIYIGLLVATVYILGHLINLVLHIAESKQPWRWNGG